MTALLVAATGGHLAQLHRLASRLDAIGEDRVWVTFDTPQSRSLLAEETTTFVPYVAPRKLGTALLNTRHAARLLRSHDFSVAVSTGSAVAMSFLPLAQMCGCPTVYIESAARSEGPSMTGRMLEHVPGVTLCTQYKGWADDKWKYIGSVFDDFVASSPAHPPRQPRKILVTLGTIAGYSFRRLVERLITILPREECEVIWQIGDTDARGLGINGVHTMGAAELALAMRDADVVVAHAGIGSAISALEAGKFPILVPRTAAHGEHVDDHQRQIATELDRRGLAMHRDVEGLTADDLWAVMASSVSQRVTPLPIHTGLLPGAHARSDQRVRVPVASR
jgi:UDP-N-acetylglucosamine--N-acetylmuramyl-(pentapeptide) pyrophosphoryl-undecaprenol N-acetylglucosamine transferase